MCLLSRNVNKLLLFSAFVGVICLGAVSEATTIVKKNLDDLLVEADGVVLATVDDVTSRVRDSRKGDIDTFVSLSNLQVLHGRYAAATLVLRLEGGEVEGVGLWLHGSPRFTPGERVLLFVRDNGKAIVPIVGWTQGVFRVATDAGTGAEGVFDHDGNRVFGVANGEILKERAHPSEAIIVDDPSDPRQRGAHAGTTDDGSPTSSPEVAEKAATQQAIPLVKFLGLLQQRLKAKGIQARTLTSVDPTGAALERTPQRDAPPPKQ
ncbi:MAG: hypothetical protein GEV06_05250 [Luteitalea sp.]|nr:hypothetical protein [Luteitalea sp.]